MQDFGQVTFRAVKLGTYEGYNVYYKGVLLRQLTVFELGESIKLECAGNVYTFTRADKLNSWIEQYCRYWENKNSTLFVTREKTEI